MKIQIITNNNIHDLFISIWIGSTHLPLPLSTSHRLDLKLLKSPPCYLCRRIVQIWKKYLQMLLAHKTWQDIKRKEWRMKEKLFSLSLLLPKLKSFLCSRKIKSNKVSSQVLIKANKWKQFIGAMHHKCFTTFFFRELLDELFGGNWFSFLYHIRHKYTISRSRQSLVARISTSTTLSLRLALLN
jgi:hypothetical protein